MCICSYMYRSCIESLSVCITGLYLADCYEIIHAYRVINILNCKFLWSNQVQYAPLGREVHMYKYMYNLYSCMYMYKIVFFFFFFFVLVICTCTHCTCMWMLELSFKTSQFDGQKWIGKVFVGSLWFHGCIYVVCAWLVPCIQLCISPLPTNPFFSTYVQAVWM